MSRQLEQQQETRESTRRLALIKALEYELVGSLEIQGVDLIGFALKFGPLDCLMTLRAIIGGESQVAFVGSDTIINCILKAVSGARNDTLKWRRDKFAKTGS